MSDGYLNEVFGLGGVEGVDEVRLARVTAGRLASLREIMNFIQRLRINRMPSHSGVNQVGPTDGISQ